MQPYFSESAGHHHKIQNAQIIKQVKKRQIALIRRARALDMHILIVEYYNTGDTDRELTDELEGYKNHYFFTKDSDGLFERNNGAAEEVKKHLKKNKIRDLIITGANGGACVKCTIEGALDNKFRVWADSNAIADFQGSAFTLPYVYLDGQLKVKNKKLLTNFRQTEDPAEIEQLMRDNATKPQGNSGCGSLRKSNILGSFKEFFTGWKHLN